MARSEDNDPDGGSELVGDFVRIFLRGSRWYANAQFDGRQLRKSLKTTSKKEARVRALRWETELQAGEGKRTAPPPPVAEVIRMYTEFLETEGRAEKTLVKYKAVFKHIETLAQKRRARTVADLDLRFWDAYRAERTRDGVGRKTLYTESVVIRQVVNFALTRGLIAEDPMKGVKLKKPKPVRQPCWTFEQVQQILAASPPEVRPALTLLAETGLRFGEMAWLTWEDVDLAGGVMHIRPKDGWKPKTGASRQVPIFPTLMPLLKALPRTYHWVVTMPPSPTYPAPGRQWTERRLLAALKRVLDSLGLPGKLHTFRHAFVSNALLEGTAVTVVREWVGHVDDEVLKLYTHVHAHASQVAMQRLAEANRKKLQAQQRKGDETRDSGSAQVQHTPKEGEHGHDVK